MFTEKLIGIFLGAVLGICLCMLDYTKNVRPDYHIQEQKHLISECEKALPRNQKCVIVLSTRIENVEEQ
jgi:hypothetical protein